MAADISSVPADLTTPPVTSGPPAPGQRVRCQLAAYRGTGVHHALYLPVDWPAAKPHPVIVEYPGNGVYHNEYGDYSSGNVQGCNLGYGLTAGRGALWISMPFVNPTRSGNQIAWWGDVQATVDYCHETVREVCQRYHGDPAAVILSGFSRGAIACGYIGLHDDRIAGLWRAFLASSHYDGVRQWGYAGDDRAAARLRLARLRGRPSFIAHELTTGDTEAYLKTTGVAAPFTFQPIPFRNHTNTWVLRDIPARRALRDWYDGVLPPA